MQESAKILVIGRVPCGELASCIDRINKVNSKSNFDCVLLAGGLDENEDFTKITRYPAVPVYFGFSCPKGETSDGEIITNVIYTPGILKLSSGVKIGLFSNSEDQLPCNDLQQQQQVDILITRDWPQHIQLGSKIPIPTTTLPIGNSEYVNDLVEKLKPRYHFLSTQDIFYEREPFRYLPKSQEISSLDNRICRFISLATFGNNKSCKWFYAFNLQIQDVMNNLPGNLTASPYDMAKIDALRNSEGEAKKDYLFARQKKRPRNDNYNNNNNRQKNKKSLVVNPESCFFCLSNPSFASHLVISIGEESYIAGAKGPLVGDLKIENNSTTTTTGHVLIIPLTHASTYNDMGDSKQAIKNEMNKFESALVETFYKKFNMATCAFEINRSRNVHIHRQVIAIKPDKINQLILDFNNMASMNNYPSFNKIDNDNDINDDLQYLLITFYSLNDNKSPSKTTLCMQLPPSCPFDLQFPRKVLAHTLNLKSRVDWRAIEEPPIDIQQSQIDTFKHAFQPFDFT